MFIRFLFTALAVFALSTPALAKSQDSALTENGSSVIDKDGDCVRTKWMTADDPCAPTPPPKKVVQPAPVPDIALEERTVYFDFNKASINETERAKVDSLVSVIARSKGIRSATVLGYADEIGTSSYNIALSKKRAATVRDYLGQRVSIPTNVLMVGGKGEADSVTNCPESMNRNERIECLAKDRRVEIEFNYVK